MKHLFSGAVIWDGYYLKQFKWNTRIKSDFHKKSICRSPTGTNGTGSNCLTFSLLSLAMQCGLKLCLAYLRRPLFRSYEKNSKLNTIAKRDLYTFPVGSFCEIKLDLCDGGNIYIFFLVGIRRAFFLA